MNAFHTKCNIMRIVFIFLALFAIVKCYPVSKKTVDKRDSRIEKGFPNGTVIGKYEYTDKDGNPVEVKYYADDSRYGVELNSLKIIHGDGGLNRDGGLTTKPPKVESDPYGIPNEFSNRRPLKYPSSRKYNVNIKNLEATKAKSGKTVHKTISTPDYEIYLPNVFNAKECAKENVRVYNFDKPKRVMRNTLEDDEMTKFCEQF